jgi:TrkA domain protein
MTHELSETRLPGVGVKFTMRLESGARLAIIQRNDGMREVYVYRRADDEEPDAVVRLGDEEARQLGAVIGGVVERPKFVEDLEMALGELSIEWIDVPEASPAIGKSLAECAFRARTGVTIIAILRGEETVSGAQPDDVIRAGDKLVTVGKAGQYGAFRELLAHGPI